MTGHTSGAGMVVSYCLDFRCMGFQSKQSSCSPKSYMEYSYLIFLHKWLEWDERLSSE